MATASPSTNRARVMRSSRLTSWEMVALAASRAWALPTRPTIWPLMTRATAVATTRAATDPRARPMMARRRLCASAIVPAKSSTVRMSTISDDGVEQLQALLGQLELIALEHGDDTEVRGERATQGRAQLGPGLVGGDGGSQLGDLVPTQDARSLLTHDRQGPADHGEQVEGDLTVGGAHPLDGLALEDLDRGGMGHPVGLDPEVLELLGAQQLGDGLLHELLGGHAQGLGQEVGLGRQGVLGHLLHVERLHDLVGQGHRHGIDDARILGQRTHRGHPGVGVEQRPVGPHPHRADQQRDAGQHRQDADQHLAPPATDATDRSSGRGRGGSGHAPIVSRRTTDPPPYREPDRDGPRRGPAVLRCRSRSGCRGWRADRRRPR